MRETDNNGSGAMSSGNYLLRPTMWTSAVRLAAVLLGVGLVLSSGPVRAQDDEQDDRTFEEKLMDNLMSGLGAKRMEDSGINYRERSPLVVPSKIDLPRPETGKPKLAPNWPKDPDEAERKAAKEARKQKPISPEEARMPLLPSELAARAPKGADRTADTNSPGSNGSDRPFMLMPSELGYVGGLFKNPFSKEKKETAKFEKEPDRDELTQPPVGYQTPSPSYAYGLGDGKERAPKLVCDAASGKCEKIWD
ncbi:hypothetical protein [Bradyrhizobium sp. SYSU BS000235]|uniref:hypothetical protein n=1 Tax=Bradyrhizobium sp. SYSU BS000235 TaxID=3411332 RepID=UPI003C72A6DF